jgi:preprotein translocase subunit SecG
MEFLLNNLLALSYETYQILSVICIALSVLCAIFVIIVVMMQPGNSNGIDALSGSSDTFYGKNKSKTIESKLRILTVISVGVLVVLMVAFYLIQKLLIIG